MAEESDALFAEGQDRMTPEGNPWQQQPKHRGAKKGFSNSVFGLLAVALPLGLVSGYANILFLVSFVAAGVLLGYTRGCLQLMIDQVMEFGYGEAGHDGMAADDEAPLTNMICSLAIGGLCVGFLTYHLMPNSANIGFSGVLEAVRIRNADIDWREGVGVALISAVSIGVGASVGRYGPSVHIGAAIGSSTGKLLGLNKESVVTLLAAGVSGSIAASFHAPFAGVVFVHEVILQHYSINAFAPTTMSAVVGMLVGELHNSGKSVLYFDLEHTGRMQYDDFVLAVCVGILAAIVSLIFMHALPFCVQVCRNLPIDTRLRPFCGALILAPIIYLTPQVAGLGVWSIQQSFTGVCLLLHMLQPWTCLLPLTVLADCAC